MPNLTDEIALSRLDHEIDLLRYAAGANRRVRVLLYDLRDDLAGRLAKANLSATNETRLSAVLKDVQGMISGGYGKIDALMTSQLGGLVATEAAALAKSVNKAVGVSIMDGLLPKATINVLLRDTLILGAPSSEWWLRQAGDLRFRFATQIRLGMMQGETNAQLISRVRAIDGLMGISYKSAEALVRTSVMTVANRAALATMQANRDTIAGMQQISTLDDRTTEVCIAYDRATWDIDGNPIRDTKLPFNGGPPRHWNCRSVLVPITKTWRDMGIDVEEFKPTTRAAMNGVAAGNATYSDWLKTRSEEMQNDILGKGKAEMWRAGKITVQDLLDQSGRPMTLKQLQDKHAA